MPPSSTFVVGVTFLSFLSALLVIQLYGIVLPSLSSRELQPHQSVHSLQLVTGINSADDSQHQPPLVIKEIEVESPPLAQAVSNPLVLPPDQVFREWKQWHSKDALWTENDPNRSRQYMVAEYSCPRQAGNILHDFTSALLQAMVTNRTLVFRYNVRSPWKKLKLNNETECQRILQRQEWIPRYEDVVAHFNYTGEEASIFVMPGEDWTRDDLGTPESIGHHRFIQTSNYRGLDLGWARRGSIWRGLISLEDERTANYIAARFGVEFNPQTIAQLYSEGIHYLYGMLFFESFRITEEFNASVTYSVQPETDAFSIGLHSRHPNMEDDGSDVQKETMCLEQLLAHKQDESQPCAFYLMADRPATMENLIEFAHTKNCSAVYAVQEKDEGESSEHGAFAGAGFFRDLVVVGRAQSAFAGMLRSSTALVLEVMDYNRVRAAAHRQKHEATVVEPLPRCYIGAMKLP